MSQNKPLFSIGQNVRYIGIDKMCTVNKVIKGTRSYSYRVTTGGKMRTVLERFLEPVVDVEESIIDDFIDGKFGTHMDYKLFQIWFRLAKPLESNVYSYLGSKTIFNPHQFKPLLRFLSSNSDERLFIADEVGVGKTIETGIILNELMARERIDCHCPILIICPHSLGPKWVKEMKERFHLTFHLHDGRSLRYILKATLQDGVFPKNYIFSVAGLQLIRREEYLTLLRELDEKRDAPVFRMIVIDEAHHMRNPETDSNKLGDVLSSMTEMMLMLSATPLNLRNEDLYNQMHILNPVVFPDETTFRTLHSPVIRLNKIRRLIGRNTPEAWSTIFVQLEELGKESIGRAILSYPLVQKFRERLRNGIPFSVEEVVKYERLFVSLSPLYHSFTRTRKREAFEHQVHREAWELSIDLSEEEMQFYAHTLKTMKMYYLAKGKAPQILGFITNTHRRMVSSCIPAMREYLEWCIRENRMIFGESTTSEEAEDDGQLSTIELDPFLKREFVRLFNEAEGLESVDSKYSQFKEMIEKVFSNLATPQVIVFSFFVRTLKYLKRRLENDGFTVGIIYGEIPLEGSAESPGRYEIMDAFKRGDYQILLSSEVGGEGLDFQYCRVIINYDLPYNPMRIEQRIGRIDRFGQKADKIIIGNLFIKETVDEEIYDRLYRRIRLVEDGIGALEPILGTEISDIQTAITTGGLTEEQEEELSQRIERAVAAAKREMEEFEKHRRELLSDDYLTEPINRIAEGDFVSPEDAVNLTRQCLSQREGCEFIQIEKRRGQMKLSRDIVSKLEQFLRRPGNERGYGELKSFLSHKRKVMVVFDGSIAEENPDHIFLSPTGYWIRFLCHELERKDAIRKVFSFGVNPSEIGIPAGKYIAFLFEVRMEAVRTEIEFWGVLVDSATESIVEIDLGRLPRVLANLNGFRVDSRVQALDPNVFLDTARDYLDGILEEKRKVASEEYCYRVESRIAALRRSNQITTGKLKGQMEDHISKRSSQEREPDERYLRLTKARIEKEAARLHSKIRELQKRQDVSLDHSLEAIVYLHVVDI